LNNTTFPKQINNLIANFALDNGYLLCPEFFDTQELETAKTLVDSTLSTVGIPQTREEAKKWVRAKSKIQRQKTLLDLVNKSKLRRVLGCLVSQGIQDVSSCQIAYRFPGERVKEYDNDGERFYINDWHIDNYTTKDMTQRQRIPPDFTMLVGIYLEDNISRDQGNFVVFPGGHHQMESYSCSKGWPTFF